MKCTVCSQISPADEMVVDHILPRSHPDYQALGGVRLAHQLCLRRLDKWYWRLWFSWLRWIDSLEPCHKERMGYTCHHRIMSNGKKECE